MEQIIIGTVLGGSSIIKPTKGMNCYLSMRDKRAEWLEYKARELSTLASDKPFTLERTNRWHSCSYPIFNKFRDMFYNKKGKRKVNAEELVLADLGWAIWFGDCGKYEKESIVLNTHVWGEKGTKSIINYFSLCDYKAEIFKERNGFRVKLDKTSSRDFLSIARPHLPPIKSIPL